MTACVPTLPLDLDLVRRARTDLLHGRRDLESITIVQTGELSLSHRVRGVADPVRPHRFRIDDPKALSEAVYEDLFALAERAPWSVLFVTRPGSRVELDLVRTLPVGVRRPLEVDSPFSDALTHELAEWSEDEPHRHAWCPGRSDGRDIWWAIGRSLDLDAAVGAVREESAGGWDADAVLFVVELVRELHRDDARGFLSGLEREFTFSRGTKRYDRAVIERAWRWLRSETPVAIESAVARVLGGDFASVDVVVESAGERSGAQVIVRRVADSFRAVGARL